MTAPSVDWESRFLRELRVELDSRKVPRRNDCCDGNRCHLILDLPFVCVSCDGNPLLRNHQGKRPDFLIAFHANEASRFHWVVIEMKSTWLDDGDVKRQLTAAFDLINEFTPPTPSSARLILLVLHTPKDRRVASIVSKIKSVPFRSGRVKILSLPCGSSLSYVLGY